MAESRKYNLGDQLDIEQILLEAQSRWLRPAEICEILQNHQKFHIAPEPPNRPPNGSLFLFDRKVLRYFRKDGHNWRKKKDGKTVKEAHERLKAGSVDVLHCYYAHGEDNENFQRRSYWMLEEHLMHIVLVHYRDVKGSKTSFGFPPNAEVASSSRMSSPVSSVTNGNQVASSTDTTSLNSAQTSEYEDTESESHQASSTYRSFLELPQSENRPVVSQMNSGLMNSFFPASGPSAQGDFHGTQLSISGLDFVPLAQEHQTAPFRSSVSSRQPPTMDISQQGNMIFGQPLAYELHNKQIALEDDSSHVSKWSMEQTLHTDSGLDLTNRFHEHRTYYSPPDPFYTNTEQKNGHPLQSDLLVQLSDVEVGGLLKSYLENDLTVDGNISYPVTAKKSLLESSRADSFDRWMSKELGEVDESHMQSSSRFYWNTVESEDVVNDTSMSPQLNLDAYLLSPSLSRDQLFSIIDFSPNWAYTSSETKVLITGTFLKSQEDVAKCKWSCMFGAVEVPAEVLGDSVLRCHAPLHKVGRIPFYVTCSNRLACSEVREFEYRVDYPQDSNMSGCYSGSDIQLHVRLGKLLSLGSVRDPSISTSTSEKHHIDSKISSFMKEEDEEWFHMTKITSEEEFYPGKMKEQLLQKMLKDKLHDWLLQKATEEDGKGLTVLDKEGQGVLHLAAALDYDWAIEPAVATGVSINFRDINGWTALHWAAFYGREQTVGALVSLGAAPGVLTDPTPEFPTGRTPADLASENGHKGIAGYLAESSLTTHLSTLNLKDAKDNNLEISGVKAVQTISERSATQDNDFDAPDASLKDSLTAVCNATQAAARIHQVFRVQSFHHKKLIEYGDDKIKMSDEKALSLISIKSNRPGHHDEPVHTAAIRIQNKFRGWKGRKEFMVVRQRIVKIQAHVRGHQVRNRYKPIIWSVGIVEKVILRWRRKGSGLRGFRSEPAIEGPSTSCTSKEDDYDFLKQGKKQTEQRLQKALARVKSMVQYPEARDQYRRLLTVVTEFQEAKDVHDDMVQNSSEETGDEDLINLEALLDDDTFMSTTWGE